MNAVIDFERVAEQKAAESKDQGIIFYGTKDVAKMLDCSVPTARNLMRRTDFPLIMVGSNLKVSKSAFEKWAMERRI